jgi:predicted kinase
VHFNDFARFVCGRCRLEIQSEIQIQHFAEYAGGAQHRTEIGPLTGAHASLFDELALRSVERRLARFELAGGKLPHIAACDIAILPKEAHAILLVDGDRRSAAGMMDYFEPGPAAIREIHFIHRDADDAAFKVCRAFFNAHATRLAVNPIKPKLLLVTGLPASGKSTVARLLARRYGAPLIAKDAIKEPLFDVLGADSAAHSRKLSDASFAVMFALTRDLLAAGVSVVLEGNFRAGEHEDALRTVIGEPIAHRLRDADEHARMPKGGATPGSRALVAQGGAACDSMAPVLLAQLLCRIDEAERIRRLAARANDPTRHPGHRDFALIGERASPSESFLSLEGEQLLYEGDRTLAALDTWWSR